MGIPERRHRQRQPLMRRGTTQPVQLGSGDVRDGHTGTGSEPAGLIKTFVVLGASGDQQCGRGDTGP